HYYLDGNTNAIEFCSQDWYHHVLAVFTCNLQQDRYQKMEKSMAEMSMDENEISITSQGKVFAQIILFASSLERCSNEIVFKAMGRAINKILWGDQIIYRRTHKLNPLTSLVARSGYGGFVQDNILEVPYFDRSCSCTLLLHAEDFGEFTKWPNSRSWWIRKRKDQSFIAVDYEDGEAGIATWKMLGVKGQKYMIPGKCT
ncbi:hypothetical protein S83_015230, partial [Arachis hypogaea]